MKNIFKFFIILSTVTISFLSCKKDSTTVLTSKTFVVKATSKTNWVYFNFDKDDTLQISNASESNEWDLAFERYKIKTNGGKSGKGIAGVFKSGFKNQTGFDSLNTVPSIAVFATDDSVKVEDYNPANPQIPIISSIVFSGTLYSGFIQQHTATGTLFVPTNDVFIVKTAKGKYAKVWIKSYYSDLDGTTAGYIKITYKYQADGSKNLQ
jgi:hypothetical protein